MGTPTSLSSGHRRCPVPARGTVNGRRAPEQRWLPLWQSGVVASVCPAKCPHAQDPGSQALVASGNGLTTQAVARGDVCEGQVTAS